VVPDVPILPVYGTRITAASSSTCAINSAGGVECWGEDFYGELGNNTTGVFNTPQQVVGLTSGIVAIAADVFSVCAVTTAGTTTCWGENNYGQLGDGMSMTTGTPVSVSGISTAVNVAGGGIYASCILLNGGAVSCMGGDYDGNLALGSITSQTYDTPQASKVTGAIALAGSGVGSTLANCAVLGDGTVQCWGFMKYSLGDGVTAASGAPFTVPGITHAVQVATSGANICIVLDDGTMLCWGENLWGEVGDGTTVTRNTPVPTTLSDVAAVSIGSYHTCVVTTGGAVKCIGYNASGQLGNGSVSFGATTTWQDAMSTGVLAVACGDAHTCALMADGKVYCWGDNNDGEIGDGTFTARNSPVLVTGF
jgi:alpha-tubulin suppressor-like RCC1 family protein